MQEFSIPAAYQVDPAANLSDMVWTNATNHPHDDVIFRDINNNGAITTQEFRDLVAGIAKGLIASGIKPGDRVAIMSRTRFEWALFDFAIWAAGGVTVPVYETSSAEQIQWILSDSQAVAVIVESPRHAVSVAEVRNELPALRSVWQIDADPSAESVLLEAGAAITDQAQEAARASRSADDLATLIYTSGTTGQPKGCQLSHRNFMAGVGNALVRFVDIFNSSGRLVMFLPMAHVLAREVVICCIGTRAKLAFCPDPQDLLAAAAAFEPTFMLAVPRVFEKLFNGSRQKARADGKGRIFDAAQRTAVAYSKAMDTDAGPGFLLRAKHRAFDVLVYRKIRAVLGGHLSGAISGGAPLGAELAHFFRGIGVEIYEGWGLTETTAAATVAGPHEQRVGTVGQPLGGTSIAIADDGEILVKGDIVMAGYWNNPQATAAAFSEGWLRTGDLGQLDEDGYLSITGRKKEILVTAGGKNVAPAPLEERLRSHFLISQCMVIGDGRPFIAALVTIDPETIEIFKTEHHKVSTVTLEALREDPDLLAEVQKAVDSANGSVSRAEQIKVFRILKDDFTIENGLLTPSMKVKRDKVAAAFASDIAAIYG